MARMPCKDCKGFVSQLKPWNEDKIPEVAIVSIVRCSKCRKEYEVYKGMINIMPPVAPKRI